MYRQGLYPSARPAPDAVTSLTSSSSCFSFCTLQPYRPLCCSSYVLGLSWHLLQASLRFGPPCCKSLFHLTEASLVTHLAFFSSPYLCLNSPYPDLLTRTFIILEHNILHNHYTNSCLSCCERSSSTEAVFLYFISMLS